MGFFIIKNFKACLLYPTSTFKCTYPPPPLPPPPPPPPLKKKENRKKYIKGQISNYYKTFLCCSNQNRKCSDFPAIILNTSCIKFAIQRIAKQWPDFACCLGAVVSAEQSIILRSKSQPPSRSEYRHPIVRSITTDREIDFFTGWVPSCVRLYQPRYLSSRPGGQSIHCGASVDQYTRYRHVCEMQNSRNIRSVLFYASFSVFTNIH